MSRIWNGRVVERRERSIAYSEIAWQKETRVAQATHLPFVNGYLIFKEAIMSEYKSKVSFSEIINSNEQAFFISLLFWQYSYFESTKIHGISLITVIKRKLPKIKQLEFNRYPLI